MYEIQEFISEEEINSDLVKNLVNLYEEFSKTNKNSENELPLDVWDKIASELKCQYSTGEACREKFYELMGKYSERSQKIQELKNWEFYSIFKEHQNRLNSVFATHTTIQGKIDYIVENMNFICRFCLKSADPLKLIFDDTSEQTCDASNIILNKIQYTLNDPNDPTKIDYKLSNFICDICLRKIETFYEFKKQCQASSSLMSIAHVQLQSKLQEPQEQDNVSEEKPSAVDQQLDVPEDSSDDQGQDCDPDNELSFSENSSKDSPDPTTGKNKSKKNSKKKKYVRKTQQCQVCGKMVVSLKSHMFTHTGERKYKCQYCDKSFMQPGNLGIHVQSHLNVRKFKCDECGKDFVHRYSLKKHMVVHNKDDKRFACTMCDARFTRQRVLRLHEKTHRQERNYICDVCNKAFLLRQGLKKHYRIHTGEKPYKCSFCDKRFSTSYNKKVHQRVHTNEKPFKCGSCDLSFSHRSSLRTHQERIHNNMFLKKEITSDVSNSNSNSNLVKAGI